jgi:hypothetical protein
MMALASVARKTSPATGFKKAIVGEGEPEVYSGI